ncbi:MAG: protein of unknown function containing DUF4258 domain [Algoriphagus marincola HL-49]|uniref:DUF4258 domain-containing protein n=1 Tax=Algoriphagus marincola HL-49 TaxID=1305737 RepID=A0A0P7YEP9_9BACT|nr:MAG: protein of unknown function containing DUF4258 domain [Algoriphagus marincola HL-49]
MNCSTVKYSDHAVIQMFKRNIDTFDIEIVLKEGEIIKEYPDDKPFPSLLMLGCVKGRAIHLVVAVEKITAVCIIITTYIPDPEIWRNDFKTKK